MSTEIMRTEIEGHIGQVILCNPKKRNSMGVGFREALVESFTEMDENENVRVVILRAEGKSFCAGLDLMAFATVEPALMALPLQPADRPKVLKIIRVFQDSLTWIERCKKPVVAAIHGHCIGGGLDIAAACDVRICSNDAVFSLREARVAMTADLGSLQRLPPIIGEGHTRQLAFTAEDISAERALTIGLVNDVYDDVDSLNSAAFALAEKIAANAPLCIQATKEVLNWGRGRTIEESLEYVAVRNQALIPSEDVVEAVSAFAERRTPVFKGR